MNDERTETEITEKETTVETDPHPDPHARGSLSFRETTVETDPMPDPAEENRVETPDQTVTEKETTVTIGDDK